MEMVNFGLLLKRLAIPKMYQIAFVDLKQKIAASYIDIFIIKNQKINLQTVIKDITNTEKKLKKINFNFT